MYSLLLKQFDKYEAKKSNKEEYYKLILNFPSIDCMTWISNMCLKNKLNEQDFYSYIIDNLYNYI